MEQAKKRDRKIFITGTAIAKVPFVRLMEIPEAVCWRLWQEHRNLLEAAKEKNHSDEVLTILSFERDRRVQVLGDEFHVRAGDSPEAFEIFQTAGSAELYYLHNHPSTNTFSLPDIFTLIKYAGIKLVSVVTNQGEVYILYKLSAYDFAKTYALFMEIMKKYESGNVTHREAVANFLKRCREGGLCYAKGK